MSGTLLYVLNVFQLIWCTGPVRPFSSLFAKLSCTTFIFPRKISTHFPLPFLRILFQISPIHPFKRTYPTYYALFFSRTPDTHLTFPSLFTCYISFTSFLLLLNLVLLGDVIYENRIKELFEVEEARFVVQTKKSFEAAVTR